MTSLSLLLLTMGNDRSLDQDELRTMIIETVQSKALFPNIFSRSRQQPRTSSPQFGNGASSLVDMEESKSRRGGKLFIASSQNESMHPRSTGKVRYVREKSLSHAEASQWIVGGPPQRPLLPKLGIGRLHADSFYSSHLPVPLTDYNYTSPEVRLKSHSKIVDFQSSVSLRSPETVKPPRASSLAFADLVAQGDYSKERTSRKSFKETAVRISHFKSIMSASR
uniref:Uncharacterized protein n=1 Tax=Guillardia theta TaxID=55529 RepID=A0A7S4PMY8_GUITH